MTPEQEVAVASLLAAEEAMLVVFGWVKLSHPMYGLIGLTCRWQPPPGYLSHKGVTPGQEHTYGYGHAVNSQKWNIFSSKGALNQEAIVKVLENNQTAAVGYLSAALNRRVYNSTLDTVHEMLCGSASGFEHAARKASDEVTGCIARAVAEQLQAEARHVHELKKEYKSEQD